MEILDYLPRVESREVELIETEVAKWLQYFLLLQSIPVLSLRFQVGQFTASCHSSSRGAETLFTLHQALGTASMCHMFTYIHVDF